jgi:hypothetical protein
MGEKGENMSLKDLDIDKEIAEKIMGWKYIQIEPKPYTELDEETGEEIELWYHFNPFYSRPGMGNLSANLWKPTIIIGQTMEVMKKMREDRYNIDIHSFGKESWAVRLHKGNKHTLQYGELPTAFCIAALSMVEN